MYVLVVAIIFIAIISVDLFAGGLAYGTARVKVGFAKALVINIVGKILIGSALFAGFFFGALIPEAVAIWLSFTILFGLGLYKVLIPLLKRGTASKTLQPISIKEAVILGAVLAFDGVAMAFGTVIVEMPIEFIFIVLGAMLVTDQVVLMGANRLGLYWSSREKLQSRNFDWVAGVILIIVAVVKLFLELYL